MEEKRDLTPKLAVIGVGGAGSNAVNNMIRSGLEGVNFITCNTDAQALEASQAKVKIQLGLEMTRGLGAGSRPDVGKAAAQESLDEVLSHIRGANMIFVTAGMGGGTGTGGAPVIAKAAQEAGILTVGVVTRPFHFEGSRRTQVAEEGIEVMRQCVDTLLVIPNQNLFRLVTEQTTFGDAFAMADDVLYSGVRTFTDLMIKHGLINLDFADICAVMREMKGKAMMGTGQGGGERRAIDAAEQAISCPLLDSDITMKGARAVLINITGGPDMTLIEVEEAANRVREEVDPNANIIFGATFDEGLDGELRVAVVATGIDAQEEKRDEESLGFSQSSTRRKEAVGAQSFISSERASSAHFSETIETSKLGHKHDLFLEGGISEDSENSFAGPSTKEDSLWADFEEKDSQKPEPTETPPVKKRSFSLLERLGMRRSPLHKEEDVKSDTVDTKDASQDVPNEDEDVPAFMRQRGRG